MFKSEFILLDSKTIGMADHNTIVYEVVYSGYRQITGLLFIRYGIHAASMMFGDGVSTSASKPQISVILGMKKNILIF